MKVVQITSAHSAFDTRIFHRLSRTLVEAGHDVVLIAPHEREEVVQGVQIRPLPRMTKRYRRMIFATRAAYRAALAEDGDLYHFHDPELIPAGTFLKARGKTVVYDVHEYYSEVIPKRVPRALRPASRWLTHLGLEAAPLRVFDRLVFPTTELRDEYADERRGTVLYNYPRLDGSNPTLPPADEKRYDVVFVGTISPFRMKVMLDVATILAERRPEFKWLFVGIPPRTVDWARRTYPVALLERHVEFVGRLPYEQLLQRLTACRIGYNYHPMEKRFRVAVPVKVLEYMLAGLPAVTSAFPELRRVLREDKEIVFPPSDGVEDHAKAIERLLDDEHLAAAIGAAGRRAVLERLNWETAGAPKLLELYDDLVRGLAHRSGDPGRYQAANQGRSQDS